MSSLKLDSESLLTTLAQVLVISVALALVVSLGIGLFLYLLTHAKPKEMLELPQFIKSMMRTYGP